VGRNLLGSSSFVIPGVKAIIEQQVDKPISLDVIFEVVAFRIQIIPSSSLFFHLGDHIEIPPIYP